MSDVQGGNLMFRAGVDDSDIERGFKKIERDLKALTDQFQKGSTTIDAYADQVRDYFAAQRKPIREAINSLEELGKVLAEIKDGSPGKEDLVSFQQGSLRDLRERLKVIEAEDAKIEKLSNSYKILSDQHKAAKENLKAMTDAGKTGTEEYNRLDAASKRIGKSLEENEKSVKGLAEGYTSLGDTSEMIEGMGNQFRGLSGAVGKLSGDNDALRSVTERLNSAFSMANDLKELGAAVDVKSIIGTSLLTKAKTFLTGAVNRLAAAFGIATVSAEALMAALTLGLSVAITGAMALIDRYNAKQEEAKKKLLERLEVEKSGWEAMAKGRNELEQQIRLIRNFNGTKDQEKKKIDELNSKYGETFGHFKTLNGWYETLINKGGDYIQSLYLQAKAQEALSKAIKSELEAKEVEKIPASQYRGPLESAGDWLMTGGLGGNYFMRNAEKARKDAINLAWSKAAADKSVWEEIEKQQIALSKKSSLGGHEDPDKGSKKEKEKDPFIKKLEDKKKAYEEYARSINSNDEIVRNSAEKTYAELLKGGKSYVDWLKNERNKVTSGNADLLKKWNVAIADADTETITGKLEKQIKDILDNGINKTKEKISELEKVGSDILPGDPLKIEKEKLLQTGLTQLRKQSLQEEKKLLEETLKEYGGFLQEKLDFDQEYNEKKAALNKKLTEQITEDEKQAVLEAMANLDAEQTKLRNKSKIKGVKTQIQTSQYKLEKDLFEIEKGRYKWRADRDKERLEKQKQYNLSLQEFYKQLQDLDPTKENLEKIKEILEELGIEFDKISNQIERTKNDKLFEMLEGIEGIAGALAGLDGSMGEVFRSISSAVASVNQTIKTFNDDTLSSSEKNFAAAATIIEGVVSLINMATTASKNRKEKEREFYQNQIALAHEYALALNEQLLLQSKLNGSGFVRNYAGEINDAFSAATDVFAKYQEAIDKLENGKAKTGLRNVIDWGNVGKGAATGAAAGAAIGSIVPVIGNAIGAVVGAVVGGIVGLFSKKTKDEKSGLLEVFPELVDGAGNLNKELAQTLINTNQVDDATKQLLQNALEWSEAVEKANEQIKNVVVDLAGDLGNSLRDALVEAFKAGEDAGAKMFEAAGKSLEKFVENLVYSTIFSNTFKEFEDMLAQSLNPNGGDGNIVNDYQWLLDQMAKGQEVFDSALQQIKDYAAGKGFELWNPSSDATQKGLAGAIKGMSQQSADVMTGHLNRQTIILTDGVDMIRQQLLTSYAIEHNTRNIDSNTKNIEPILKSIDSKTKSVDGELRASGLG